MRYVKPDYYDSFSCTADRCPDTCCAGWQIVIDEDSLEKYEKVQGPFGNCLRNSIDWEEGCFYQYGRRCAFLNERNLCDLYLALGEEGFCDTCRNYPRHTEEFEGLRERSLSLSCPVAAEILLSHQGMPKFVIEEDDSPDPLEEEFEEFDLLLFTQLEDARNAVFADLEKGKGDLWEKMGRALALAKKMQDCLEDGTFYEIDELIENYSGGAVDKAAPEALFSSYMKKMENYESVRQLERLREEWTDVLREVKRLLYAGGKERYLEVCGEFRDWLESVPERKAQWENAGLQLFVFFVFTYFCGAVYDDCVYSKMALAVRSVEFIRELLLARWKKNGTLEFSDYVELSYRYAREIEHSDQNLNALEELYMEEIGYGG